MAINALSELEDFGDGQRPWCDLVFEIVDPEQARKPLADWLAGRYQ